MRRNPFKPSLIALLLSTAILSGSFSTFAQRRPPSAPSTAQVAGRPKSRECDGGYKGTVSYTKTVATSSSGKFGSNRTMRRVYQAQIQIRDDGRTQGSATVSADGGVNGSFNFNGRVEASETETLQQLDVSEKDEYCNVTIKGRGTAQRVRCESRTDDRMQASGASESVNVFLGLRGRTMILSIGNLPRLSGTVSRQSSTSCTGTCTPTKPLGSSSSVETNRQGERTAATDEGVIQFNPESFNRLSGSWTRTSSDGATNETFQWHLSRCAPALEIADIRFEHKRVPNPDKWVGIDPLAGTIDGNTVKIKARVFNHGGDTAYANVKFFETKSNEQLPDAAVSVAIKPGEARDVEYEWDTSGFAWDENMRNQSEREIRAELEGGTTEKAKVKILPKPVIMVHGLWSNAGAWAEYPAFLSEAHSFAWRGFAVGADPAHGKMETGNEPGNHRPTNTIYQNARELEKQIKFTRESMNAWHVDIVAHSMGGLISRQYINSFMQYEWDMRPSVTHLVMLGTPNQGSPCADIVNYLFEENGHNDMQAMRELKPIIVRAFNARVTDRKKVLFSVMAGTPLPFTCNEKVRGDLVVPLQSALYTVPDRGYTASDHLEMTGKKDFLGFVLPRLAVGPKKAQRERYMYENFSARNRDLHQTEDRYGFKNVFRKASYKPSAPVEKEADESLKNLTTRQRVELASNQAQEIEIAVNDGDFAGVVLVATPSVSATLLDAGGAVAGKSNGGTEAVKKLFRTIAVDKKVTRGTWKLKLENLSSQPSTVFVAGFAGGNPASDFIVEAGDPSAAGTVQVTAKLTERRSPVVGAKIKGRVSGQTQDIVFYDDGKHGDGEASDGVYGASIEKLPRGEYFIEAKAEANNQTRIAVASITVGTTSAPSRTPSKTRRGQ
jgi:pimeloyl-ACP methyl ester carboxylesterase